MLKVWPAVALTSVVLGLASLGSVTPAAAGDGCPKYWRPDRSGDYCVPRDRRTGNVRISRDFNRYDDDDDQDFGGGPRYYQSPPPRYYQESRPGYYVQPQPRYYRAPPRNYGGFFDDGF